MILIQGITITLIVALFAITLLLFNAITIDNEIIRFIGIWVICSIILCWAGIAIIAFFDTDLWGSW